MNVSSVETKSAADIMGRHMVLQIGAHSLKFSLHLP
jgi:hypothetical protein